MNWIIGNFKWVMVASGALTCTMIYAAFAPQAALTATFGRRFRAARRDVVRNWGALISLVGLC